MTQRGWGKKLPRRGEEIARRSPPPPSLSLSSSSPLFSAAKSSRAASDALTMAPGTRPPSRSSRRRVCLYGKTLFRRRRLRRQRSSSRRRLSLRLRVISLGRASRRHCVARSRRRLRTLSLPPSLPPFPLSLSPEIINHGLYARQYASVIGG